MASLPSKSSGYSYSKIGQEKGDMDTSPGRTSIASENDGLMGPGLHIPLRPRRNRLRRFVEDPLVNFLFVAIMFTVLIALAIMTVILIRGQYAALSLGHKPAVASYDSDDPSKDLRAPNGLRITEDGRLVECGETAEAAKANGCPFDSFAFAYVPPACFEKDVMEEALNPDSYLAPWSAGQFPFYKWSNFTEPVPQTAEELSKYKSIWSNNTWHKAHCIYEWRLMARAMHRVAKGVKPVYVMKRALEIAHVNHCNQMVSDPVTQDESPVWAMRAIGRCIRVDQYMDEWEEPELNL